jgi:5'-methylthioinosine phosphorylase
MADALGLIVGSGFESLGLAVAARSPLKTPYGPPSSPVLTARVGGTRIACIARHGERHELAPHEINYRANVWALAESGVRRCVALNVVGAIEAGFEAGDLAVPEQLIDYTHGRASTFGSGGAPVVHVEFTEPFDRALRAAVAAAVDACGYGRRGGVYGVTQGPRLETAAEIDRLERDGCTMVGMTAMPEAVLAHEKGVAYAMCALAVNRAAGRGGDSSIGAEIEATLASGMGKLAAVLRRLVPELAGGAL